MAGNRPPGKLHRHDGRRAFEERNHHHAQDVEIGALFLGDLAHAGSDRPHQPVTQQNSQKSANQRGRYFVADFFRRSAQRSHGDDDAQHGGHDAQAGQGIGHAAQRSDRHTGGVVVDFQVEVQQLVEIKGFHSADGHAQGVAEVVASVMVFQEADTWRGSGLSVGFLDVIFQGHQALRGGPC